MAEKDNTFVFGIEKMYAGLSPLSFLDSLTEYGSSGHASTMQNVDCFNGSYVTQGPALANLTNGTEAGAVTEIVHHILDKAVADDVTYGIGTTKLFKISSTSVENAGIWPHAITGCTEGGSVHHMKGKLYYFYNKTSGGDMGRYDLSTTFDDDWGSTVPTGAAALQNAPHPSDSKEDVMLFGNGKYVGVLTSTTSTIDVAKLDFGDGSEVADVIYNGGFWYIAVNSGITGANRTEGQIYLYDGAAISSTLEDEAGVGMQRIGFLYRINGIIYVAYQDISSTGFIIGFLNGKSISPLVRFTGTLPTFQQKTLYKNTILFLSSAMVYSAGAVIGELPFQLSQLADGGYATCGAIAAPFGTPMIASGDGTHFKLAKFSGYDVSSLWKSIVFSVSKGRVRGIIDSVVVQTSPLETGARCDLTLEYDQGVKSSTSQEISGTGGTRFVFSTLGIEPGGVEDVRVALSWANGSATNPCKIRRIIIQGHYLQSI